MTLNKDWFTEESPETGLAFSLKVRTKLHEEQTQYQLLEVYETECFGHMLVLDGFIMLTQRDNFIYHEMMAHPALFIHPKPEKVAIVGGGDCGTLHEVLKHTAVKEAWQIEIDERVTRISEQYFPELCASNNDPRAHFAFEDGIAWVEQAEAGSVDVLIVDSTDPIGPAEGLFREPFYQACFKALKTDGLLVQQSESPLVHAETITYPMSQAMQSAGFPLTQTFFFPLPTYPTGWWSGTIASKNAAAKLSCASAGRQNTLKTQYYNAGIHQAAFAQPAFFNQR